jgi:hypothetical protein
LQLSWPVEAAGPVDAESSVHKLLGKRAGRRRVFHGYHKAVVFFFV